jgi:hypothetical protein
MHTCMHVTGALSGSVAGTLLYASVTGTLLSQQQTAVP